MGKGHEKWRTATVLAVWDFLESYLAEHGMPPTRREIRDGCYISLSSVQMALGWLEALDVVEWTGGKARGIRLLVARSEWEAKEEARRPGSRGSDPRSFVHRRV